MTIICNRCDSDRIAFISAKCSNLCSVDIIDKKYEGYVPDNMGIGGGDYIRFSCCLNCGQIMGIFPIPVTKIEIEKISEDKPLDKNFVNELLKGFIK
jgi:hypothetical protein